MLLTVVLAGCATPQKKPKPASLDNLKTSIETFHRVLRWGNYRDVAQMIAPEARADFLKQSIESKDDDTLKVLEYELEDAQIDGNDAVVLSKLEWHRLPDVNVKNDLLTSLWEYRDGTWLVTSLKGGPFELEKHPKPLPPMPQ